MPRALTEAETGEYLEHGFVVVPDFLGADELAAALDDVADYLPTWDDFSTRREEFAHVARHAFDWIDFPFRGDTLTDLAVSPEILDFVSATLGAPPFLTHCLLWPKYAGTHDFEQRLHVDYPNNTLVYPRDDGIYRVIPFILYLTDVTVDLGPTWVVSQQVTGSSVEALRTDVLAPEDRPDAYEAQRPVAVPAGSLLVYSLRTFHRGSAFTAEAGHRFTLNFSYRAASCLWAGLSPLWPARAPKPEMHSLLTRATPAQRGALGFPMPGDPYWNDESIAGVAARYPDMDLGPYRTAAT